MERLTKPLIVPDTGEVLAYMKKVGITDEKIRTKVGKYEDLEEQGLLLRLPCKFNETVYWIRPNVMGKPTEVMETRFDDSMISRLDLFGKVFFTSREEAEAALEKMKGE